MENIGLKVESPRFTPVRRHSSTINNRPQQGDSEKEWTATRCNRLLRALTSRVAILKKDISRLQSTTCSKSSAVEPNPGNRRKRGNTSPGDADWVHPRKKIKKTYSARGGKTGNEARPVSNGGQPSLKDTRRLIPGEIAVPTPILHRARGPSLKNQSSAHGPTPTIDYIQSPECKGKNRPKPRDGEQQFQLSKTMRDIRKGTLANRYTTYEGIYYGLEGLLKATALGEQDPNSKGPRSLLSMCLRAIPHYITNEEVLLTTELEKTGNRSAIDRRDVSTEVYNDLEAFGSSGHGWKHLRTVVRSHGIQVLCAAIEEGLIDMDFCGILVSVCVNMHAIREAETLLFALLSARTMVPPKSIFTRFDDDISTRPLSILWKFAAYKGCFSYQYRQLSTMITNGLLPISWLATKEFATFWPRAVQEFSSDSVDSDTISFLNTIIPLLAAYGDPGHQNRRASEMTAAVLLDAVKQTFSSLMATLTAVVILRRGPVVQTEAPHPCLPDYREIITLFCTCLAQWNLAESLNTKGTLIVLAVILVKFYEGDSPDIDLVNLLLKYLCRTNRSTRLFTPGDDLVLFVCSIAQCCGRGASNSGFEYLQHLHTMLETLAYDQELEGGRIVHEIIIDSAFAFARQIPDGKHLDYAASLETKFHVMKPRSRDSTPSGNAESNARYRWEEGISEWVVATPAAGSVKSARLEEDSTESECDMPFRHPTRRTKSENSVRSNLVTDLAPSSDLDSKYDYSDLSPSTPGYESTKSSSYTDDEDGIAVTSPESALGSKSHYSDGSDDELMSSPRGEDREADELSTPISSSPTPDTSHGFGKGLRYVDRAPRLSKRVLRHSLHWQSLDESDDELNCMSIISQDNPTWQDSTGGSDTSMKSQFPSQVNRGLRRMKSTPAFKSSWNDDSEDELGI